MPEIPNKFEDFKNDQENCNHNAVGKLRSTWVPNIQKIIDKQFKLAGKPWMNTREKSLETYNNSKLKKFLMLVQLLMQDSLLSLS